MGYDPIQIKNPPLSNPISHLLAVNWVSRFRSAGLSGDPHFIARFSDFANTRARFFDSIPREGVTSRLGPFPLRGRRVLGAITERVAEPG